MDPTGSSPSGGPSWQIDIPSLTSLITRAGARGLQQLAQSGVDVHTIGCILTLGEITPACDQFRRAILEKRTGQRKQSWFIHGLVEYGAGANFVVDEFLKTRAGENVLATLTSISIFPESAAIEILTKLFEEIHAPAHGTPSYGQLQAIRSVALPLARALDFKDQVAMFHVWICNEFGNRDGMSAETYYFGCGTSTGPVPDNSTILSVLVALKSILLEPAASTRKLVFQGISGAAWLLVYASKVLGAAVCIRAPDGRIVPISGSYESAKVIIIPGGRTGIAIEEETDPLAIIVRGSQLESLEQKHNWLIDCGDSGVDVVALICGWPVRERVELGSLIFSMALQYVTLLDAGDIKEYLTSPPPDTFRKWHSGDKHLIENRLRDILCLMGLPSDRLECVKWGGYFVVDSRSPERLTRKRLLLTEALLQKLGMVDRIESPDRSCDHGAFQPPELNVAPMFCPHCRIELCVKRLSFAAAVLSFTDWATNFRKLSIHALFGRIPDLSGHLRIPGRISVLTILESWYGVSTKDSDFSKALIFTVGFFCSPPQSHQFLIDQLDRLVGINLDSVLIIENASIITSLQPRLPRFRLREGEFILHGDKRRLLVSRKPSQVLQENGVFAPGDSIHPWKEDYQYSAKLSVGAALSAQQIDLRYKYLLSPTPHSKFVDATFDVDIQVLIRNLHALFLTCKCHHNPKTPLPMAKSLVALFRNTRFTASELDTVIGRPGDEEKVEFRFWKDKDENSWRIVDPLGIPERGVFARDDKKKFYIFSVAGSLLSQWASASFARGLRDGILILQDSMCLDCVAKGVGRGSWTNIQVITQP
ncbi:hypothetical protein QBC44DRAFT_333863 [Cladorrhinum sp. PSN332]|nr:hypothetical protein QBC44DRAFT_333863 [Cladorrhinum sp. PSN332]